MYIVEAVPACVVMWTSATSASPVNHQIFHRMKWSKKCFFSEMPIFISSEKSYTTTLCCWLSTYHKKSISLWLAVLWHLSDFILFIFIVYPLLDLMTQFGKIWKLMLVFRSHSTSLDLFAAAASLPGVSVCQANSHHPASPSNSASLWQQDEWAAALGGSGHVWYSCG